MYPLHVVLVGCSDGYQSDIRRELANQLVWIQAEYRDVAGAVAKLANTDEANLLFLMYVHTPEDLQQLRRLSSVFPNKPILVLRDRDAKKFVFSDALHAGAAFAIPVPLDASDLRTALDWISKQYGFVPKPTAIVAVAGVGGGQGATTIAINLAYEIGARHNRHVLLTEASPRIGMLATYLQVEPRFGIQNLLDDLDNLDIEYFRQVLVKINDNLDLLASAQQAIQSNPVPLEAMVRLLHYARPLADVVVVDVLCTYDDLYFEMLKVADHIVLVFEQTIPSVRALQMVRDALHIRNVAPGQWTLVINRYDPRVKGFKVEELQELLHVKRLRVVANDSAAVLAAISHGRPLRLQAPQSPALADIDALTGHILETLSICAAKPAAPVNLGMFGRMARTFGLS